MIVNSSSLRTLGVGYNAAFNDGFASAKTFASKVSMKVTSTTSQEEYGWLNTFPRIREWLGDRVVNNLTITSYRIKNRLFESTVSVRRTDIEDDNIGIYAPMFKQLGQETAEHPDELIASLMLQGFLSTCYDGQYFFDLDHPVITGGVEVSQSNFVDGAGAPWFLIDNTRAIMPFIYQERLPFTMTSMTDETDEQVFRRDDYLYGVRGRSNAG